jgi:cobalamin biosynthesis Mg chelatase CobN
VDVDTRRVKQVVVGLVLVTLAVLTVVFFIAGANKNAQQTSLSRHGVPVQVTVTNCIGEMGGSGSTPAGYACTGSYTVDGKQYVEAIPGNTAYDRGSTVQGLTVPGNPTLLSTASVVRAQPASWTVFIVPIVLLVVLLALVGLLWFGYRRRHRPQPLPGGAT